MQSLSYGCFSTGMCDDRVKTLIDWQEGPFREAVKAARAGAGGGAGVSRIKARAGAGEQVL